MELVWPPAGVSHVTLAQDRAIAAKNGLGCP